MYVLLSTAFILTMVTGCGSKADKQEEFSAVLPTLNGDGNVTREALDYEFLMKGSKDTIVDFSNYAVPENAAFPSNLFLGELKLKDLETTGRFEELVDWHDYTDSIDVARMHLPSFNYKFVQSGSHIIPLQRGYIENDHPNWEYILEPGRVWDENGDNGYSRAAIPFTLKQRNQNCVHNGVMMFLFNGDGSISNVSYQVASETCAYFQFNMWGTAKAEYQKEEILSKDQYFQDYADEVDMRMPSKPIAKLSEDYPMANPEAFSAPEEMDQEHLTMYGFVIDGTNYVGGCNTRYGVYPYCDVLVGPSYSTAKSVSAGLGLMRLEKEYPRSKEQNIAEFIEACNTDIWSDVTFENALDMATGNYELKKAFADESSKHISEFFASEGHQGKIEYSCGYYERKSDPGTEWVYHTSDTYILGTAMNNYIKKVTNDPEADYFADLIVEDILNPLGISPTYKKQQRTYGNPAQPFSGFGIFYHHDDAAKIGHFLINGGIVNDKAVLDEEMIAEIIRPKRDSSMVTYNDTVRYDNGFWFLDVTEESELCAHDGLIPYMAGYGGIKIMLLPNNTVYYYFSDNFQQVWREGVFESNRIRPFCTKSTPSK